MAGWDARRQPHPYPQATPPAARPRRCRTNQLAQGVTSRMTLIGLGQRDGARENPGVRVALLLRKRRELGWFASTRRHRSSTSSVRSSTETAGS